MNPTKVGDNKTLTCYTATMPLNDDGTDPPRKLLVCGLIRLVRDSEPVEVRRGMPVLLRNGGEVGTVAAVVLDCRSREVTHILLGYVPPTAVYHLVSPDLIDRIDGRELWLSLASEDLANLPEYRPGT